VGAFSRQEMIVGVAGAFEYYSLGVNERLGKEKID
jgi:hypothetical protein